MLIAIGRFLQSLVFKVRLVNSSLARKDAQGNLLSHDDDDYNNNNDNTSLSRQYVARWPLFS
jgi:hypothetical protein